MNLYISKLLYLIIVIFWLIIWTYLETCIIKSLVSLKPILFVKCLCSSSEGRPFRLGTGANMDKVVKMDRDMTKVNSACTITVHFCT